MLLKLLGWIWVVTGVLFLLKPAWLREKLKKKSIKKVRKIFFGLALFFGILLIKAAWGIPGLLANIVLIFGILGIIKAFYFLKGESSEKLIHWFTEKDDSFFRMWAVGQIAFGAILLTI